MLLIFGLIISIPKLKYKYKYKYWWAQIIPRDFIHKANPIKLGHVTIESNIK